MNYLLAQSGHLLYVTQQTVVLYLKRKCQYIAAGQRSGVQLDLKSTKPHVGELVNHTLKLYWVLIKLFFFHQANTITFPVAPVHDSEMVCSMIKY